MNSVPADAFNQLIKTVRGEYREQEKLSENTLSMLLFMFDSTAVQALDLVDHRCIFRIVSPSGRTLYKVERRASEFYVCLENSNYCTCPSFIFHVLRKGQFMCKHKLAAMLSRAMGLCKEVQYADETLTLMLAGENSNQL